MELVLERIYKGDLYTIGKLYVDGVYQCDTLEDVDRNLNQEMSLEDINKIKVFGKTAIPYGKYKVTLKQQSSKFSKSNKYEQCKGYLPRLIDVPAFSGILIHIGNTAEDSNGCILVGQNLIKGKVINSTICFWALYQKLKIADDRGEKIWIVIK